MSRQPTQKELEDMVRLVLRAKTEPITVLVAALDSAIRTAHAAVEHLEAGSVAHSCAERFEFHLTRARNATGMVRLHLANAVNGPNESAGLVRTLLPGQQTTDHGPQTTDQDAEPAPPKATQAKQEGAAAGKKPFVWPEWDPRRPRPCAEQPKGTV